MAPDLASAREEVVSFLESLIEDVATGGHRELLRLHLVESSSEIFSDEVFCPIDLPVLGYYALAPDRPLPVAILGACTLIYLGADLLDDVADRELSEAWIEAGPDAATLAATTFLSSLTYLAIDRHDGTSEQRSELMRVFAEGLVAMSAGQYGDVENDAADSESSLATTELKAGAEFGVFMKAAAIGADTGFDAERFAEIGRAVGTAVQLASDIHDTFRADPSPDLRNGRTTLPVTHATSVLQGSELDQLRGTLAACAADDSRHAEARELLRRAGGLRYAALIVQVHVQRATRLLGELDLSPGPTRALRDYVTSISLFRAHSRPSEARTFHRLAAAR